MYILLLYSCIYIFNLDVKPWSVPLQVVVGLRRGQMFWSRRRNKIFTGIGPRPITTYFKSGGTSTSPLLDGFIFRNGQAGTDLLNIDGLGNSTQLGTLLVNGITCRSTLNASGTTILNNSMGVGTLQ